MGALDQLGTLLEVHLLLASAGAVLIASCGDVLGALEMLLRWASFLTQK